MKLILTFAKSFNKELINITLKVYACDYMQWFGLSCTLTVTDIIQILVLEPQEHQSTILLSDAIYLIEIVYYFCRTDVIFGPCVHMHN